MQKPRVGSGKFIPEPRRWSASAWSAPSAAPSPATSSARRKLTEGEDAYLVRVSPNH